MKTTAILFSGPMVRAIGKNLKTMTRRAVTEGRGVLGVEPIEYVDGPDGPIWWPDTGGQRTCPYGMPGDRLVFLSTWGVSKRYDAVKPSRLPKNVKVWTLFDGPKPEWVGKKRPGRFMPLWMRKRMPQAEVTGVKVERLHAIPPGEVDAEGLDQYGMYELLGPVAKKYKTKPEHWIHGSDESLSYCRDCAEKRIAELKKQKPDADICLDGGFDSEGDSQAFCETCHHPLDNTYTTYACETEVDHFTEYGFDISSPDDCYSLDRIMGSCAFLDEELNAKLKPLCFRVLWEMINGKGTWDANPWVWCISFKRIDSGAGAANQSAVAGVGGAAPSFLKGAESCP